MKPETPRQWLFFFLGWLFLGIGIIGIFVPLLPTTAFLLLSAACFSRSSERFYHWLLEHPIFGKYIRNYRLYHAITLPAKLISLGTLWVVIGITVVTFSMWWLRGLLLVVAVGVTIHLLRLRTLTPEMIEKSKDVLPASE